MRNIRQNLFWAFSYNTLLIPVAAGVLYPFGGPLLSPVLAAGGIVTGAQMAAATGVFFWWKQAQTRAANPRPLPLKGAVVNPAAATSTQ